MRCSNWAKWLFVLISAMAIGFVVGCGDDDDDSGGGGDDDDDDDDDSTGPVTC